MKTTMPIQTSFLYKFFLLIMISSFSLPLLAVEEPSDKEITRAVERELRIQRGIYSTLIDVETREGIVTLDGTVDNLLEKERSAWVAKTIRGVRGVVNQIDIETPAIDDAMLQKDITDAWLRDPATESYELQAKANNGTVTLSGDVQSWQEKQLALKVAKGVRGVKEIEDNIEINYTSDRADREIENEVEQALYWDVYVDASLIQVNVNNGKVKLKGIVGSAAEKNYAISTAWVEGVKSIEHGQLEVQPWAENENKKTERYPIKSDTAIEKAVRQAFVNDARLSGNYPRVESADGYVTLTGTVNNLRAQRAAVSDARNIAGVVRVKNYIHVRPAGELSDAAIKENIDWRINKDPYVDQFEIDVAVYNGIAYLSGNVDSYFEKIQAENAAESAKGVVSIRNKLKVEQYPDRIDYPLNTTYYFYPVNSTPDWEIREDVESQIWWSPFVDHDEVVVDVDNGTVVLTGTVDSWRERLAAERNAYEGGAVSVNNQLEIEDEIED